MYRQYHIAQNFDGGNIDGFDNQLAIRQKFSLSIFFNCKANTGCLVLETMHQYFPYQTSE